MSMEPRWNGTERGKPKKMERNLRHYVCHKCHMDCIRCKLGPPCCQAGD